MGVFVQDKQIHGKALALPDLRAMVESDGPGFVNAVRASVDGGQLKLADLCNLRDLYQHLADVEVKYDSVAGMGLKRSVTTSAFPILLGSTMVAALTAEYEAIETIGQMLVTEMADTRKLTTVARIAALDNNVDEVKEAENFPEIGAVEDYVTITHRKNGRKLTVTKEMVTENDLPGVIQRVNKVAEFLVYVKEMLTLKRVTDYTGSKASPVAPYAYKPLGSGTALYSATANTPGTRAPSGTRIETNALVDETDLDNARLVLAAMKDDNGRRIPIRWSRVMLLVPYTLVGVASKIIGSEYVPGVENEIANYGMRGMFTLPKERVLTTNMLDDLSTSAWYLGDFKSQFMRKTKASLELVTLGMNTQEYLDRDIAFQARASEDVEVGAVDYTYVVQNLAAATAPGD